MTLRVLATLSDGIINEVKSEGRVENLEKNHSHKKYARISWYRACEMGNSW